MIESTLCVIPARFDSKRLPGKVLLRAGGASMLEHCWRNAMNAGFPEVLIATDNPQIEEEARGFGANVVRTGEAANGTERAAMAAQFYERQLLPGLGLMVPLQVLILQADCPTLGPGDLKHLALTEARYHACRTLGYRAAPGPKVDCPDNVKIAVGEGGNALYFSRAPIPYSAEEFVIHVGVYCYGIQWLRRYKEAGPCVLELREGLEQLRTLHVGGLIHVGECGPHAGIDTMADFQEWRASLALSEAAV